MTTYTTPPLPLNSYGRAASAPKAPAEQPPAPQPKAGRPEVAIPDDDSDNPDVTTVLTDDATAEDIAAAAGRCRRGAQLSAEAAEHSGAEAEKIFEAAREEVAKITARAEAEARPLTEAASAEAKRAAALDERSRLLQRAAQVAVTAEKARAAFQSLKDEREQLAEKHAELGQRRSVLDTERRDLEARLAAAREAGDLDAMTTVKATLAAIEDLNGTLQARQAPMQQRMEELGTGTENFSTHPILKKLPPLAYARDEANRYRTALSQALNMAMPERPEAVAAAERQQQAEYNAYAARARDREAAARPSGQRWVIAG